MPSAAMTISASAERAIGEGHPRDAAVLLETGATMSGMHRAGGQGVGQHVDEVGAVHAEGRVPARGVRHLHRRDRRAVVAEVTRTRDRRARPTSRPPAPVRPAADAARCWGSGTRRRRSRRSPAPARRPTAGIPCAISALAANRPPIPPPTIATRGRCVMISSSNADATDTQVAELLYRYTVSRHVVIKRGQDRGNAGRRHRMRGARTNLRHWSADASPRWRCWL